MNSWPATRGLAGLFTNSCDHIVMAGTTLSEKDLYAPIKALLETQGYEVKGEVGPADIVAVRGDEEPVIVEMKLGFSLSLFHQAADRQRLSEAVYVAVSRGTGKAFRGALKKNIGLCRRLGLGLMTVRAGDGRVEVHLDPAPYRPRKAAARRTRLLAEFARLEGDPNIGGSTRRNLMTSYRQDALRCLHLLNASGPMKAAHVAAETGVSNARRLMADNHYGWFERVATGVYGLSPNGRRALVDHAGAIARVCVAAPQ